MSKVLIIAGMHRSGTSLITHWLNRCGLFVGNKLAGPDIGNSEGFYEDLDFQQFHKKLLRSRNCSPIGFEDKRFPPLEESEKKELQKIINSKQKEHTEWGWKDPITCLFLDTYRELIPSAFYLVVVRDYKSAVSSLVTREHKYDMRKFRSKKGLSRLKWQLLNRKKIKDPFKLYAEKFLRIWIHYYAELFDHVSVLPAGKYIFTNYLQLVDNDRLLFDQLKDNWNFSLNYFPFSDVYKIEMISEVEEFEKYIRDKKLLEEAKKIEAECNRILSSNHQLVK